MKKYALFILVMILALVFVGCNDTTETQVSSTESKSEVSTTQSNTQGEDNDMFSNRDFEIGYDDKDCVSIILNGNSAVSDSDKVIIKDSVVTITDEGTYIISGELTDGMIVIDADDNDKPQIVLNNATVTSSDSAALYVKNADKVFITLGDSTTNSLANGGEFDEIDSNNIDGAIFAKDDITFNGNGSLTVTSPAAHGIVCKDDVKFTSGTYEISCAYHGIDANDSVRIANAEIKITAGKDGIHVDNSDDEDEGFLYYMSGKATITAEGDGISVSCFAEICGGEINITAGGGSVNGSKKSSDNYGGFMGGPGRDDFMRFDDEKSDDDSVSMKGIKAQQLISISNCKISADCADDTIHSNGEINIISGDLSLSSGDDGIHADEKITITNGTIDITESYEGIEALDIVINGGEISLVADDDGINAAGGNDESGFGGRDGEGFMGGEPGGRGGFGGGNGASNGSIVINGGTIYIEASGDGIDANGDLEINGGYICSCGPTVGDTAVLDYDNSAVITGGTYIGTGSISMAQSFSSSENQGVLALNAGNNEANTKLIIKDANGNILLEHEPKLSYQLIIYSSPQLKSGETYTVTVGDTTGEFTAS